MDPGAVLRELLGRPDLGSVGWVTQQYDSTVGTDTVVGSGHGAAVLRIKGTRLGLVAATDANATVAALRSVARRGHERRRSARATSSSPAPGRWASPTASTSATPSVPEAFWQLSEAVRGLADAARALGMPVTGGNVSLYNESPPAPSCRRPRSASSACSTTSTGALGPPSPPTATSSRWPAKSRRAWRGSAYAAHRRRRARRSAAGRSTSPARAALHQLPARRRSQDGLLSAAQDVSSRRPRGGAGRDGDLGRTRRRPAAARPAPRRPSSSSARAQSRAVVTSPPPMLGAARAPGRRAAACRSSGWARPAAIGCASSSSATARPARPKSAAPASRTRSKSTWTACATPGRAACRALLAERLAPCAASSASCARPGGGAARRARPVRAAASRPGIGRRGGQRRPSGDGLQGPWPGRPGPRRAPPAVAARRAGDRPLPLLDDRLDDLGEQPADVPPGATAHRGGGPQRQPGQHAPAARDAARRQAAPGRHDRHRAADRAAGRGARRRPGRGAAAAAAAGLRRLLAGGHGRAARHRRARSVRLPAAGAGRRRA